MCKIKTKKALHGVILGVGTAISAGIGALVAKMTELGKAPVPQVVNMTEINDVSDLSSLGVSTQGYVTKFNGNLAENLQQAQELFGFQPTSGDTIFESWVKFGAEMSNECNEEGLAFYFGQHEQAVSNALSDIMAENGYLQVSNTTTFVNAPVDSSTLTELTQNSSSIDSAELTNSLQDILQNTTVGDSLNLPDVVQNALPYFQTGLEPWQNGAIGGLISCAVLVGIPATIFAVQKHKLNKLSKQAKVEK